MARRPKRKKSIEALTHDEESRKNIPTAELESVMSENDKTPLRIAYERRNRDLDPQLVWRGKDEQDEADLVVQAAPLYIQEKIHPKVLIDDLASESRARDLEEEDEVPDLFADFNGLPNLEAKTEFYQHDQNWSNRMILGDSLQVMASLAEREGLRGNVQCIYVDPPYGIEFNSNFQWSTTTRDVRDGKKEHVTREPEQVRAFRDTWRDGIHSYLAYLRDRLCLARDLLTETGSIFVQIGDQNAHRVRVVMDEVFGDSNFVSQITFKKSSSATERYLSSTSDYILWYARHLDRLKFRPLKQRRLVGGAGGSAYMLIERRPGHWRPVRPSEIDALSVDSAESSLLRLQTLTSQRQGRDTGPESAMGFAYRFQGQDFRPSVGRGWTTTRSGLDRLSRAGRIGCTGSSINYKRYFADAPVFETYNIWNDTQSGSGMKKVYVVQTNAKVVERCLLMATDPGDLVLDPTSGAGTTAFVAEQWGRRWIAVDTSRVALALARARIMGARFPYYLLADSRDGRSKEAEVSRSAIRTTPISRDVRQGFVYERVPHVTLKSIVDNVEIDVIHERLQPIIDAALRDLNGALSRHAVTFQITRGARRGTVVCFDDSSRSCQLLEWEVPSEIPNDWPSAVQNPFARFWETLSAKQREIDASIAAHADSEYLFDKPYEGRGIVRVAGPFTVESLTPHRVVEAERSLSNAPNAVGEAGESRGAYMVDMRSVDEPRYDFRAMVIDQLRTAGVQQADKRRKIDFASLVGWPGNYVCAEGRYLEGEIERRAGILIGPEHGTVGRGDLMAAAREAGEAAFDVLIACAFNYDAQATDANKLGRLPILKARMNADLQMSTDLKKTKTGNLFVVFGEPDIEVRDVDDERIQVKINGVDLFDPQTGDVRSSEAGELACWFIDTDYDMASFFVRHAYFLGANDPYRALKTTLKAEVDAEAWETLHSDTSRPFSRPRSGRIAVKAINHLGDEVLKVVNVS